MRHVYNISVDEELTLRTAFKEKIQYAKHPYSVEKSVFFALYTKSQKSGFYGNIQPDYFWIRYIGQKSISSRTPQRYFDCKIIRNPSSTSIVGQWRFSLYWRLNTLLAAIILVLFVLQGNLPLPMRWVIILAFLILTLLLHFWGIYRSRHEEKKVLDLIEELLKK